MIEAANGALTLEADYGLKALEDALVSTAGKPNVAGKRASIRLSDAANTATSTPSALIRVAVLDTGISQHPDLSVMGQHDVVPRSDAQGVKDRFAAANYHGTDGVTLWGDSWVEYMDNNNPHSGTHMLVGSDLGYALQIKDASLTCPCMPRGRGTSPACLGGHLYRKIVPCLFLLAGARELAPSAVDLRWVVC